LTTLEVQSVKLEALATNRAAEVASGASAERLDDTRHLALRPARLHIVLWAAMLLAAVVLTGRGLGAVPLGYYRDDADYVVLARSLFHAPAYGMTVYGKPQPGDTPFPFGYPLIIAPFQEIPALALDGPRLLSLVATLANAALLFWGWPLLTANRSSWWALSVSALHTLSPQVTGQASHILTEPVFMTLVLAALMLAQRIVVGAGGWGHGAVLGFFLALAITTRTIGAFVLGAAFLCILLARRREAIVPIIAAAAAMTIVVAIMIGVSSADLRDLFPRQYVQMVGNVDRLTGISGPAVDAPPGFSWWEYVTVRVRWVILPIAGRLDLEPRGSGLPRTADAIGLGISVACLTGFAIWVLRYGWTAYAAFAAIYFVALIFWPWSGRRYLYVIQPALYFAFLLATTSLAGRIGSLVRVPRLSSRSPGYLGGAVAGLLLLCVAYASFRDAGNRVYAGDLSERAGLLAALATPPTMLLTDEPALDHVYSGMPTIGYPAAITPDRVLDRVEGWSVSTVVVGPTARWSEAQARAYSERSEEMAAALEQLAQRGQVTLSVSSPDGMLRVYRVLHEPGPG
jgi:hypothetical protein